jgi:poly-gamma-glutamate synthesis protein (capsule biosynthesis protein)
MIAAANNHSFDYGSLGVLETMESISKADLVSAGIGPDLQSARNPAFFQINNRTVALISVTATFAEYGVAGRSRVDMIGRPGPSPLAVSRNGGKIGKLISYAQRFLLNQIAQFGVGMTGVRLQTISSRDSAEILESIGEAKQMSNYVVLSIHVHEPGVWIEDFAHRAIDAGVDIFFSHGPHTVSGIEIYNNRPIFYGLGNFTFQYESTEKLPADAFEFYNLDPDSEVSEYFIAEHESDGSQSFRRRQEAWEGLAPVVEFNEQVLTRVSLIPLDLGFNEDLPLRGIPRIALEKTRDRIYNTIAYNSRIYGTRIEMFESREFATVKLTASR